MSATNSHFIIAHFALYSKILENFPNTLELKRILLKHRNFVLLGANSPDLPYTSGDFFYGDKHHYEKSGLFIKNAIQILQNLTGETREKCLAWLCGYISHLVADSIIHPMVNALTGVMYNVNPIPHQTVENHQDSFAFHDLNIGEVTKAEFIDSTIKHCSSATGGLDEDIEMFWSKILKTTFPACEGPNTSNWFRSYVLLCDNADERDWIHIRALAKIAKKEHLLQIPYAAIKPEYVHDLPTPDGVTDYRNILNKAIDTTAEAWLALAQLLEGKETDFPLLENWDMDTGCFESGEFIFYQKSSKSAFVNNMQENFIDNEDEKSGFISKIKAGAISLAKSAGLAILAILVFITSFVNSDSSFQSSSHAFTKERLNKTGSIVLAISAELNAANIKQSMDSKEIKEFIREKCHEYLSKVKGFDFRFNLKDGGTLYLVDPDNNSIIYFEDKIKTPALDNPAWQKLGDIP